MSQQLFIHTTDLAAKQAAAQAELARQKSEKREQIVRTIVPLIALVVANIIFVSLDIRAIEAVYIATQSPLLAISTIAVSGAMAILWWDVFLPHARRYNNNTQRDIAVAGILLGFLLSGVLAFLDYIVRSVTISTNFLWATTVALTIGQGGMMLWYHQADDSIIASAKRQKSLAARVEQLAEINDWEAELKNLENIGERLEELARKFPGKQAAKAARAMGYPILASMLEDDDKDGIPNYKDKDWRPELTFAQDVSRAPGPQEIHYPNPRKPQP